MNTAIRAAAILGWGGLCCVAPVMGQESSSSAASQAPGVSGSTVRHTVARGDTMWDLAQRYYQDHFQWRRIAEANPPPDVRDPHWIYPGQVLVIPGSQAPKLAEEPQPAPAPPAPQPEPPAAAEETALPPPPPPPAKPEYRSDQADGTVALPESLSMDFPTGLVGLPPSTYRFQALPGWEPDGEVVDLERRESAAAEGDWISVRLNDADSARRRQRYVVFRRSGPTEADVDKSATYLAKVGVVEIHRPLNGKLFRALVIKSNDTIQTKDILKREP